MQATRVRPCAEVLESRALLTILTVNSTADTVFTQTGLSLREAIEFSNGQITFDQLATQTSAQDQIALDPTQPTTIEFNLPGTGPQTIVLDSPLPAITLPVTIDGYSQPGAAMNTATTADNAKLLVVLSQGQGFGPSSDPINTTNAPLDINSPDTTVQGLAFTNFSTAGPLITLDGTNNTVQVTTPTGPGQYQTLGASHDTIRGNFIGVGPSGTAVSGLSAYGVDLIGGASNNTIGGTSPADRNVIVLSDAATNLQSGDGGAAVDVASGDGNVIEGNFIGVDATGVAAGASLVSGVGVDPGATNTTIGGSVPGAGNVIAGNGKASALLVPGSGVVVAGKNTTIRGNRIGIGADGTTPLPNARDGVFVQAGAVGTTVGASASTPDSQAGTSANIIANNGNDGVDVEGPQGATPAAAGTTILANSISANAHLGIELQTGADVGVNTPVLSNPAASGGTTTVPVTVSAAGGHTVRVDFFASPPPGTTGSLQGKTFLGSLTLMATSPAGTTAAVSGLFVAGADLIKAGQIITSTATDLATGDTSEFSNGVPASGKQAATLKLTAAPPTGANNVVFDSFNAVVAPATGSKGTPTGLVSFTIDGVSQPPQVLSIANGVGTATSAPVPLAPGPHTITAVYAGDGSFAPSSVQTITDTVPATGAAPTSVSLSVVPTKSTLGQSVTLSAVLNLPPGFTAGPTGLITINVDGSPIQSASASTGNLTVVTTKLAARAHTITATYSGDTVYAPSTSAPQTLVISPLPTKTALTESARTATSGQPVTFTAAVSGLTPPTSYSGSIAFRDGSKVFATVPVNAAGVAKLTTTALGPGAHTISAVYVNDPNYATSTSASVPLTLAASPQGPKVVSVRRIGFHASPTSLVIAFNAPLNAASAQNVFNYLIATPTRGTVLVQSAVYHASAHTVSLQTVLPLGLHSRYTLTIIGTGSGGVRGASGGLLDGNGTGTSGTNFVTTIGAADLVVTDPTAPGASSALKTAAHARKVAAAHAHKRSGKA